MSRPLRIEFPGAVYHVTARGDRREPIYRDDADRTAQPYVIARAMQRFDAQVLAYCQMGNHFHVVPHARQGNPSRLMRHINGVYTRQFRSASAGLPWRRRFRRSHAGAGVHRAAQRGRCSEGAAQVAQHVAGLPEANSGSARGAAHCIPGVRHHDDRDGQGVAAVGVAHQPTNCCGGSGRGWVVGKRQDLTP